MVQDVINFMDQRFRRKEIDVGVNKMINNCMPNIYVEINVGANEMFTSTWIMEFI